MAEPTIFCERCTTDGQCDTCYATQWFLYCKQFDLCTDCGVPKYLDGLSEEIHMKFTCTPDPCEDCRPRQARFLQSRNYCLLCFQKMELGVCYTCHCTCDPEEDTCKPYECQCGCNACRANREAYDAAERKIEDGTGE
jgi:hypothetical protein